MSEELQRAGGVGDWRRLGDGVVAWFGAPSMSAGAALVRRVLSLTSAGSLPSLDLRPDGVRVRLAPSRDGDPPGADLARSISAAAGDLGLQADPAALQVVGLAVDTPDPAALLPFWTTVLGYIPGGPDTLLDPSLRHPACSFHRSRYRPLRDRFHVDVVRAPDAVQAAGAALGQEPSGPYGVALSDVDGNEVDVVPGGRLPGAPRTGDWQTLFAAMVHYPLPSAEPAGEAQPVEVVAGDLVTAVARLSDDAGTPLLVDLRPDGVTIDSGKDRWEGRDGSAAEAFVDLAGRVQAAARDLGLVPDPARPRFVQIGLDAVDVPAVRGFWAAALGYRPDPRELVTDLVDPRRLGPVLFFQPMDASETRRREQRNRIHLDLVVPPDQVQPRTDEALTAGGRLAPGSSTHRRVVADPEGNELHLTSGQG